MKNRCPPICFHVYINVSRCKLHGRYPYEELTTCSMCYTIPSADNTEKNYTLKELVLLETYISEFHEELYVPKIQKLEFNLPYVTILGTHHCGKELRNEFKLQGYLHYVCVSVIIQNGWYPYFLTTSNMNNMVEIYQGPLKALH